MPPIDPLHDKCAGPRCQLPPSVCVHHGSVATLFGNSLAFEEQSAREPGLPRRVFSALCSLSSCWRESISTSGYRRLVSLVPSLFLLDNRHWDELLVAAALVRHAAKRLDYAEQCTHSPSRRIGAKARPDRPRGPLLSAGPLLYFADYCLAYPPTGILLITEID